MGAPQPRTWRAARVRVASQLLSSLRLGADVERLILPAFIYFSLFSLSLSRRPASSVSNFFSRGLWLSLTLPLFLRLFFLFFFLFFLLCVGEKQKKSRGSVFEVDRLVCLGNKASNIITTDPEGATVRRFLRNDQARC